MQNIKELRDSLVDNYELLKTGEMPMKLGKELSNTAGKIINSLKVELEYNKFLEREEEIPFLNCFEKATVGRQKNKT